MRVLKLRPAHGPVVPDQENLEDVVTEEPLWYFYIIMLKCNNK